ncbi:hypothetical protein A7U43_27695 (plasmid) [Mycobacterium adipatum]|uniref:Uncharacterized protein n=1 Tax=Mycobacterium adipatum TaxID=1682113 RepID=A0A172UW20_9MYCO|nr:hypothetical protein [Mycobacterium adipatum]ANE83329.1 hypothetical protein A7U43_27695 [Mycobacterium adipatum]
MTNPAALETKTVVIEWVEESVHQVTVRVPVDFDADECDLGDGLAELDDDGFRGLERNQIVVRDVAPDPAAEFFDPPRFDGLSR